MSSKREGENEPSSDAPGDVGRGPADENDVEDGTLGGYLSAHNRPPAFTGSDGHPYTVSIEVELTPDLAAPFHGYLVFPKWAATGVGVIGHVETPTLCTGNSRDQVMETIEMMPLLQVRHLLDEAIDETRAERDNSTGAG